jgi:hypothetical protein
MTQPRQVAREGRARASQPPRQSRHLRDASLHATDLAREVYLTIPQFAIYGNFPTEHAARQFLSRYRRFVPTLHRGRTALVHRLDYDRYLQASWFDGGENRLGQKRLRSRPHGKDKGTGD